MASVDSLEPFLLISSLCVAAPSICLSTYVFIRIWTSPIYNKSRYLRLYSLKALNESFLYLFNLFLLHLPLVSFSHPFYSTIIHSLLIPISGFFLVTLVLASFLYGISLSLNRYLAIARVALFRRLDERYTQIALLLIYPLPILLASRMIIWRPYFGEIKGQAGPIYLFFTPEMGALQNTYDYFIFSFYAVSNMAEFALNTATLYAIVRKQIFHKSASKRQAEIGLYVTTLCSFAVTLLFTAAQTCIQFFPLSFAAFIAMKSQLIVTDIMTLSNVYFLLAFSPALRKQIFGTGSQQSFSAPSNSIASFQ